MPGLSGFFPIFMLLGWVTTLTVRFTISGREGVLEGVLIAALATIITLLAMVVVLAPRSMTVS